MRRRVFRGVSATGKITAKKLTSTAKACSRRKVGAWPKTKRQAEPLSTDRRELDKDKDQVGC